jgi:hypothetical protein
VQRKTRSFWPALCALAAIAAVCTIALVPEHRLHQPDPYAYRASIAALLDGHALLDAAQYAALEDRLSDVDDGWNSGLGIIQWTTTPSGAYVSEKNPGYPFLAAPFAAAGMVRLAPIFFLLLGCAGLWLAGRRWLGAWGGAFTVILFCSSATLITMTYEAYMPMAAEAALVAGGGGLVLWALLDEHPGRRTVAGGALGFLLLGAAVTVRYTDVVVLGVAAIAAVVAVWRRWSPLRARWLALWALAGALGPALVLVYNGVVYGGVLKTGYAQGVSFSLSAVWKNLHTMPLPLLAGMAVAVPAVAGLVWALIVWARRRRATADRDGAVAVFLLAWWLAVWGLFLAYDWTATLRPSMHFALTSRFYISALGALALLGAYLFTRIPVTAGLPLAAGFLCLGAVLGAGAVTGDWLYGHSDRPVVPQPGMPPPGAAPPGSGGRPSAAPPGMPVPDGAPSGMPPGQSPPSAPPP